ncbi:MAG: Na+/H+ antiporter NhaC family protein [Crocinitomicaceae bacterium]|nr:Na+/H+ antiporter NhaC family protein [Crocinitomicaceae bacterium]
MQDYGLLSLLPPIVAIFLAIKTRQVFVSLLTGIWIGWLVVSDFNPFEGTINTINAIVAVFQNEGNARVVLFTLFVGSLIAFMQKSGGIDGFINYMGRVIKNDSSKLNKNRKKVQIMAALTGAFIFVESNISALTVGTVFRPIFDRLQISREKLAYIADSTSAPSKLLFPFNGWGAYIMGLLAIYVENPFSALLGSMAYNFYPIIVLLVLFFLIAKGKDFGPMKKAEKRANLEGKLIADGATPMVSDEITLMKAKTGVIPNAFNMLLPIVSMVLFMPLMLMYTGWDAAANHSSSGIFDRFFAIIGNASGSASVLYSVLFSLLISAIYYRFNKILGVKELITTTIKGVSGMTSLAMLIVLAFAIGALCKEMGTGNYVAGVLNSHLSPALIPAVLFVTSCIVSFSTGTSWGTFAIMLAIALPLSEQMHIPSSLLIAACLGGGLFGDHCSPISDTSVISSMASASDHIDHVKTQLPYALFAGVFTTLIYLLLGLFI